MLLRRAMDHGVIFVAGGAFFVDGSAGIFSDCHSRSRPRNASKKDACGLPLRSRKNTPRCSRVPRAPRKKFGRLRAALNAKI